MNDLEALSDADIDKLYFNARNAKQFAVAASAAAVIVDRLTSVSSFLSGLIGVHRFPLYESVSGFSQSDAAQGSVKDSAGNLASTAGNAVSNLASGIGNTVFKAAWPVLLGAALLAVIFITKGKK